MSSRRARRRAKKKKLLDSLPFLPGVRAPTPLEHLFEMFPNIEPTFMKDIYTNFGDCFCISRDCPLILLPSLLGCNKDKTLAYLLSELSVAEETSTVESNSGGDDHVGALPIDMFLHVCSFLNVYSLTNLGSSSKTCFEQLKVANTMFPPLLPNNFLFCAVCICANVAFEHRRQPTVFVRSSHFNSH